MVNRKRVVVQWRTCLLGRASWGRVSREKLAQTRHCCWSTIALAKACRIPAASTAPSLRHAGAPCREVPMACGCTKTIERLVAGTFGFVLIFGAFATAQDRMPPIPADKL